MGVQGGNKGGRGGWFKNWLVRSIQSGAKKYAELACTHPEFFRRYVRALDVAQSRAAHGQRYLKTNQKMKASAWPVREGNEGGNPLDSRQTHRALAPAAGDARRKPEDGSSRNFELFKKSPRWPMLC